MNDENWDMHYGNNTKSIFTRYPDLQSKVVVENLGLDVIQQIKKTIELDDLKE